MPKTLKILLDGQVQRKIIWKNRYLKITELRSTIKELLKAEDCFVGLFGVVEGGSKMLNCNDDIYDFLMCTNEADTVVIDVCCTPISRDETYLTRNYSKLPACVRTGAQKEYVKVDPTLRKTDFGAFKALKSANFIEFSKGNYSPYHVIRKLEGHLIAEGFLRLKESDKWNLVPGGKYFIKRGHYSAVIAFIVPQKISAEDAFFKIIGTHCDSPCLRLNPVSKIKNEGYLQLDVNTYGGALWNTWFDRELAVGGRVVVKHATEANKLEVCLYSSKSAFAYVPSMAPHLQSVVGETALNPEKHLRPVVGTDEKSTAGAPHFDFIMDDIANQLNVPKSMIVDAELCLADATPATIFGPSKDLLAASKMDNSVSAWAGLDAIIMTTLKLETLPANGIPVMACFDHEEIGSTSTGGANSELLPDVLKRIIHTLATDKSAQFELFKRASARSYFISADMGHAVHPNYSEYYKSNYLPVLNKGVLVKTNDSLRYTSTSVSRAYLKSIAEENGIPLQNYVGRNDKKAGSTIGPMLSSLLGIESIDIGGPLLAMHSIRELAGVDDIANYAELFRFAFLANQPSIDDTFK